MLQSFQDTTLTSSQLLARGRTTVDDLARLKEEGIRDVVAVGAHHIGMVKQHFFCKI